MLAAHADVEVRVDGAAAFGADAYEFTDAELVDRLERAREEDAVLLVGEEEAGLDVVA